VAIDQAVDSTTPSGRLLFGLLGAVAEFKRDLIQDPVMAGARAAGVRVGRPKRLINTTPARRLLSEGKSLRQVAKELNVGSRTLFARLTGVRSIDGSRVDRNLADPGLASSSTLCAFGTSECPCRLRSMSRGWVS
jgi:DNA invertase Pin-like site-specific DNA recombinase